MVLSGLVGDHMKLHRPDRHNNIAFRKRSQSKYKIRKLGLCLILPKTFRPGLSKDFTPSRRSQLFTLLNMINDFDRQWLTLLVGYFISWQAS